MGDYVIGFKTKNNELKHVLVKYKDNEYLTHIIAVKEIANFLLHNDIVEIIIYKCGEGKRRYFCDDIIMKIKVTGV